MTNCAKCLKPVNRNSKDKIKCEVCANHFHTTCAELTDTDLNFLSSAGAGWNCRECVQKRRMARSASESTPVRSTPTVAGGEHQDGTTMQGIGMMLKRMEDDFGKSLNSCHEKLDENCASLTHQNEDISKLHETVSTLQTETNSLKSRLNELQVRLAARRQ